MGRYDERHYKAQRAVFYGMGPAEDKMSEIIAEVPMAEMGDFATVLRSVTHGRGYFKFTFERYEEAPTSVALKVIEETKKAARYSFRCTVRLFLCAGALISCDTCGLPAHRRARR